MNNKEIKNLLKQKAENVKLNNNHPSSIIEKVQSGADFQVDTASENNLLLAEDKEPKKVKKFAYKSIIPIFAGALSVVIVLIGVIFPLMNRQTKPPITAKAEEVFSKEIFALGNLLNYQEEEIALLSSFTQSDFEQICGDCANYLLTGNAFLQKENIISSVYENDGELYAEYDFVATVQFVDSSSYTTQYTAYYNETKDGNEIEIDGVMIIGQKEYLIKGEREQEKDEVESELRIYLNGEENYISVSNETEVNENEFTYEWVQNGEVVKGVSLEIEFEDGLKQTELEITQNEKTQSYELTYHEQTISCEYESDYYEEEFVIYIHEQYYLFVHEDYEIRVNK